MGTPALARAPCEGVAYGRSRVQVMQRRSAAARTLSNSFQRGRSVSGYSRSSDNSRGPTTTSWGSASGVSTLHGAQRCLSCLASPHSAAKRTQFAYHSDTCSHGSLPVVPWQLLRRCALEDASHRHKWSLEGDIYSMTAGIHSKQRQALFICMLIAVTHSQFEAQRPPSAAQASCDNFCPEFRGARKAL